MKILFHHRIRSKDGQAVHMEEMIKALRCLGHEILLVGPRGFADAALGDESRFVALIKSIIPEPLYELLEIAYNIPAYRRLHRAWREFRPDFIYERHNLFLLAGIRLRNRTGVPFLLEVNAPLARERSEHGNLALKKLAARLETWVWRRADFVLPVTHVLGNEIREAGVSPDRIAVISNGVDPSKFGGVSCDTAAAKNKLGLAEHTVLGFTGFVREWHGLDHVIDAMVRPALQDTHLLVVGDGPAIPELKAQAARLGLTERVRFAGLVGRDQVADYVGAFDIALQPACVEYASPLKLFEYMALDKAIVAPAQPNILEVLQDEKSALLFDPASPESMVAAIARLAADAQLRAKLGKGAGDAIASQGLTWDRNAARVVALASRVRAKEMDTA